MNILKRIANKVRNCLKHRSVREGEAAVERMKGIYRRERERSAE